MDADAFNLASTVNAWLAKRLPKALERIGAETTADIKARLGSPCPAYHGVSGGKHSPPGHEPYMEEGLLIEGISYVVRPDYVMIISKRADANPKVPEWLEFGTPGGRQAARPYMRPAKNRGMRTVPAILRQELGG